MLKIGESFNEKLEKLRSEQDKAPNYIKRNIPRNFNVIAVLTQHGAGRNNTDLKKTFYANPQDIAPLDFWNNKIWKYAKNLITDDGDLFYAQSAASETPTIDFSDANGRQELGNGAQGTPNKTNTYSALITPVVNSRKIIDATYPKTNDGDSDNTGAAVDIVTWLTSWTKADFNATGLSGGVIHDAGAAPVGGSVVLTYWTITAFEKTADDTLKIFVNHTFTGV